MKQQNISHIISVSLTSSIQLEMRELEFLREMARHCVETKMSGYGAADRLDKLLESLGVKSETKGPLYGVFE